MDIKELKTRYPLFEFTKTGNNAWHVQLCRSSWTVIDPDNISQSTLAHMDLDHAVLTVQQQYREKYPNLYLYIEKSTLKPEDIWVCRNGQDGEAIITDDLSDENLEKLNAQVAQALQPGWFWCAGHNHAVPDREYGYYWWTFQFCKQYKAENPQHYKDAMNEYYD